MQAAVEELGAISAVGSSQPWPAEGPVEQTVVMDDIPPSPKGCHAEDVSTWSSWAPGEGEGVAPSAACSGFEGLLHSRRSSHRFTWRTWRGALTGVRPNPGNLKPLPYLETGSWQVWLG